MIGYRNKWVSSKRTTKLIMLWTNLLHQGFLQTIVIYMNGTKRFYDVSFMAPVSFQVNFMRAAQCDSKNEKEKQ